MIKAPLWIGASSTAIVFLVAAWFLPSLLGLEGGRAWILRGVLAFLGLVATFLVGRVLAIRARRKGPARQKDPEEEKIDLLLGEARSRLAAAGVPVSRLDRLPMILVAGPDGSTKTTVVTRSGMDPELLAGEVYRGDSVVPTEGLNLWYGDGVVVTEAGGALLEDGTRWSALMARLRPARLRAALLRRPQPPRVAVVCVGCEALTGPGAAGSAADLARRLRTRLGEAARELGIQLPVYVLLTKADTIPHFHEFASNLSRDEAGEVLGVTLPLRPFDTSGSYGSDQARRLDDALEELSRSLSRKRLDILPRENAEVTRQAAYEFPREIRKLADPLRDFLIELCRPGHLGASPILRGFYFTGVRPVLITHEEEAHAAAPEIGEEPSTAGATSVFSAAELRRAAEEEAPAARGTTRKVPQWVFLERVFSDVILGDRRAMGITGSGTRVSLVRRVLLGGLALAAMVALAGTATSFFMNRGLQQDVAAGLRGVGTPPPAGSPVGDADGGTTGNADEDGADAGAGAPVGAAPDLPYLEGLDALGAELDRLREWEERRPPLRYRWGLYRGPALLPEVRDAYFARFREALWEDTRGRLLAFLQNLPPEPGEDSSYEETYNALKAYLMTTDHPQESAPAFLAPVLVEYAGAAPTPDGEGHELILRQLRRFATELAADGSPYPAQADAGTVARTRGFLGEFAAVDQFYQALVGGVSSELGAFEFHERYTFAESTLGGDLVVPGAFTHEGWDAVQEILANPEELLVSEEWVVGEQVVSAEERVSLARNLEERYVTDYVATWQDFLRRGTIRSFASVSAAADGLHALGGNDSPIVHLVAETSANTAVDSDEVRGVFQPVHLLVPPESPDEEEAPSEDVVRDYLDNLVTLQGSLDQLSSAEGSRIEQVVVQAERDVNQARAAISGLTRGFDREGGARVVGDQVERILEEPLAHTTRLLGGYERTQAAGGINAQGASFCSGFDAVAGAFPFSTNATVEADLEDVKALLQPGESRLDTFHDEVLDELVTRQGGRWEPRSGASPAPTAGFLGFYNEAYRVSRALFDEQGGGPRAAFFVRMETSNRVPEVEVEVDGQTQLYTRTASPTRDFVWEGDQARSVRISGVVEGARQTLLTAEGSWGIFRLFADADDWQEMGGGTHRVTWRVPEHDVELTADVNFAGGGTSLFRPGSLAVPACVSEVVR